MVGPGRAWLALLLVALAAGSVRCAPPSDAACGAAPEEAAILSSAEIIATANVLRDAQERILPRLGESAAAHRLRTDLGAVANALAATEAAVVVQAAARASRSLEALPGDSTVARDLHAVHLVLTHVHDLAASRQASPRFDCTA